MKILGPTKIFLYRTTAKIKSCNYCDVKRFERTCSMNRRHLPDVLSVLSTLKFVVIFFVGLERKPHKSFERQSLNKLHPLTFTFSDRQLISPFLVIHAVAVPMRQGGPHSSCQEHIGQTEQFFFSGMVFNVHSPRALIKNRLPTQPPVKMCLAAPLHSRCVLIRHRTTLTARLLINTAERGCISLYGISHFHGESDNVQTCKHQEKYVL